MKKSQTIVLFTIILSVIAFGACKSSNEPASTANNSSEMPKNMNHNSGEMMHKDGDMDHADSKNKKTESADFSAQRNDKTSGIIDAYDQTKKALAANDKSKTAEGAQAMLGAFEKFDSKTLSASKQKEYSEIIESAKEHAEHIIKSELAHQKEHFESLTSDIKDLLALANSDNDKK